MLIFLLACLLGLRLGHGSVIALPAHLQQGAEPLALTHGNATVIGNDTDLTWDPRLLTAFIDDHFRTRIHVYRGVKISGKSTYMNILQAMVQLSYSQSEHEYAGGTFSFRDYTNVKIQISKATSFRSTFQYRYAVWGLFQAALYLTSNEFNCIVMDLYWIEDGAITLLGHIEIGPDSLPNTPGNTSGQNLISIRPGEDRPPDTLDLANSTSTSSNETDVAVSAYKFAVFVQLQGRILSISAVFMTLFLGLVHIASFGTSNIVHNFRVWLAESNTELVYENYGVPRTSPPFLTYHAAARALGSIPKYMFAQRRFEEVVFVVELGGIPVGQGFLRKPSSGSSTT